MLLLRRRLARFETSHVLGALLASSPLLARAWDRCAAAADGGASSLGFVHGGGGGGEGEPVCVAFSGVQAALSAAAGGGGGAEIFKPVGLRGDAAGRLFAPLVAAEPEDAGGEPVAVQALALQGFLRLCRSPEFQVIDQLAENISN
jgi:hypothetical protein